MRSPKSFLDETDDERPVARVAIRVSETHGKHLVKPDREGETDPANRPRELLSPDMQMNTARAYCEWRSFDLDVDASLAHADLDVSASRRPWRKRPGMVAHLEAAKRGEFSQLIVYKLSRFARNAREGLELFDLFEAAGVTVHSVREGISGDTATGRMLRTILLAVAELEAENISDFVTDAFFTRAKGDPERGIAPRPHGKPPAWLRKHTAENGTLTYTLHEPSAATIRRLLELRLTPMSYSRIARTLNEEGFRRLEEQPPPGMPEKAATRLWSIDSVLKMLQPHKLVQYRGDNIYNHQLPDGDPRRFIQSAVFPPVFPPEQHAPQGQDILTELNALQARLRAAPLTSPLPPGGNFPSQRSQEEKANRRVASTSFVLTGLLHCAGCKRRMMSGTRGRAGNARPDAQVRIGSDRMYYCPHAFTQPELHGTRRGTGGVAGTGGTGTSFSASVVEAATLRCLASAIDTMRGNLPALKKQRQPRTAETGQKRLHQVQARQKRLWKLLLDETISEEEFRPQLEALKTEEARVTRPERLSDAVRALENPPPFVLEPATSQSVVTAPPPEAIADFIRCLVERIEYPILIPGRVMRPELKGKPTNLVRHLRVFLKDDLLPGVGSLLTEVRTSKWTRALPPVEFELPGTVRELK